MAHALKLAKLFHFPLSSKLVDLDELHNGLFPSFQVYEDEPVLQAFKLMRKKRIGGVPVIKRGGNMAVGNIGVRDVQFLLNAPEIYHDYRYVITFRVLLEELIYSLFGLVS